MENEHIALLVNATELRPSTPVLRSAQEKVRSDFEISVSVTIGGIATDYSMLSRLYQQTVKLARDRFFLGYGSFIVQGAVRPYPDHEYIYPQQQERELVEALLEGNAKQARQKFLDFVRYTESYSVDVFFTAVRHLVSSINYTLRHVKKSDQQRVLTPIRSLVEALDRADSVDEAIKSFNHALAELSLIFRSDTVERHTRVVTAAAAYVEAELSDPGLSVEHIADKLNLSPGHLSSLFKAYRGESISQEIRRRRLQVAAELIRESEKTFEQISHEAGFHNSGYFYRLFKRHFGMTPGEYRAASPAERSDYGELEAP